MRVCSFRNRRPNYRTHATAWFLRIVSEKITSVNVEMTNEIGQNIDTHVAKFNLYSFACFYVTLVQNNFSTIILNKCGTFVKSSVSVKILKILLFDKKIFYFPIAILWYVF